MEPARQRSRQKELAREKVHLDFPPLAPAVIHHAVEADRRGLGGARRIDLLGRCPVIVVAELDMAYFMGDEKRLIKRSASILMQD